MGALRTSPKASGQGLGDSRWGAGVRRPTGLCKGRGLTWAVTGKLQRVLSGRVMRFHRCVLPITLDEVWGSQLQANGQIGILGETCE